MGTIVRQKSFVKVKIEWELKDGNKFSASGTIWRDGRHDSCGQNLEEIAQEFHDDPMIQVIVAVWRKNHLNDMKPGCVHQRLLGWDKLPIDPSKPLNTYGKHFEGQLQDSWNMLGWVRESEHPQGLLSKPCSICGYKYGSKWLTETIPQDIIEEIKSWDSL